jgi:hypothetical protein
LTPKPPLTFFLTNPPICVYIHPLRLFVRTLEEDEANWYGPLLKREAGIDDTAGPGGAAAEE